MSIPALMVVSKACLQCSLVVWLRLETDFLAALRQAKKKFVFSQSFDSLRQNEAGNFMCRLGAMQKIKNL
jgi:hypothetical protein